MRTLSRLALLLSLLVAGLMPLAGTALAQKPPAAKPAAGAATVATGLPALIPREILFGNPERINPQLSPDGRFLTYVAPDARGVLQVWLRTVGAQDDRALTADPGRGVVQYFWAVNGEQILYLQDRDGNENSHLYSVTIRGGAVRDLTPYEGVQARIVAADPAFADELLIGLNLVDARKHDVYRLNLTTGVLTLDTENPGPIAAWTADARLHVRAALAITPDGGSILLVRATTDDPWQVARRWEPGEEGFPLGFNEDGTRLYLVGDHDANAQRLLVLDLDSGAETVLAEDPDYDVGGLLVHPVRRAVEAVAFYRERLEWQPLDARVAADLEALRAHRPGDFNIVDRDLADSTWLVAYTTDDGPVFYYAYSRASRGLTLLFSHQPQLEGLPLARMQPVAYQSRDGLTIHGYLTTPFGVDPRNLPAVLLVHGGPWGRDVWGYDPEVQWLANRGYAVLQVNFRGSAGYGKAFLNAGNREWAGKMHDDLVDGVDWLVQRGIADPARIGIIGGSYGGYAALVGVTFTPDLFAAAVSIVGPSDLVTLLENPPPAWTPILPVLTQRVGDPETEQAFLNARSPLYFVDRIRTPLLIGQGANDPRVPQVQSDSIYQAMRAANLPVEYVIYADEGHGFARPANRLHFYAIAERFLATHLGGRFEPVGEIPGHSGTVR